jgi:hypothetical protein
MGKKNFFSQKNKIETCIACGLVSEAREILVSLGFGNVGFIVESCKKKEWLRLKKIRGEGFFIGEVEKNY